MMLKRMFTVLGLLFVMTVVVSSCKAKKGCGCGHNLNYYKPRKFKS